MAEVIQKYGVRTTQVPKGATASTWAQRDLTCQRCLALGTAVQLLCFANTCERCSWTGHFAGLFPESTHHRENASVELRSISPRLSLLDFSRQIQTGNSVIRGSNFDANLYPKWVNFGCNSTWSVSCNAYSGQTGQRFWLKLDTVSG